MKCQYCGKECKNLKSLKQHEIRCKYNSNRLIYKTGFKAGTKKWIYKDNTSKLVSITKLEEYLSCGWNIGLDESFSEKLSIAMTGVSTGKASTPEKELERKQKISNSMKGNSNWKYNKRHGNSKQGWYKGIHCDSTWELAFLVYYIEHNLYIEKCKEQREYIFNNEKHIYFPDFITNEGIIEVKGRIDKKAIEKQKQNPDIIVYNKHKMEPFLQYVIEKYGKDFYKKLYE